MDGPSASEQWQFPAAEGTTTGAVNGRDHNDWARLGQKHFQVHGIDADGRLLIQRRLRRNDLVEFFKRLPPYLIGLEACGTALYWARTIAALGHTVKLMPPAYVKPYVKRGKTDAADAEEICEAVTPPTMRLWLSKHRISKPP